MPAHTHEHYSASEDTLATKPVGHPWLEAAPMVSLMQRLMNRKASRPPEEEKNLASLAAR